MPDVLMLTKSDWANTGWRFMKCLQLLGLKVKFFKGRGHWAGYPEQAKIHPAIAKRTAGRGHSWNIPELKKLAESAHVIHYIASTFINTGADLSKKHVVVQHGGTIFRKSSAKVNKRFNHIIDAAIIQCPDLLGLGAKNEHLIYYPVDTKLLTPDYAQRGEKIIIGHFPRSPGIKGTANIVQAIKIVEADMSINTKFKYIGLRNPNKQARMPWKKHLNRVRGCDIIIETCNLKQREMKYGEWANTSLEAASLGKLVISNTLSADIYAREYGNLGIHVANNVSELVAQITRLVKFNKEQLLVEKKKSRAWVVNNHSLEANAIRLWERVYCNFFHGERKAAIEQTVSKLREEVGRMV